ncbi:MAG: hypothetical protein AB7F66_09215 [Bacteriovoracia bacterium]
MKIRKVVAGVLVGTNLCGCATMSKSLLVGAGTGAAVGTAAGVGFSSHDRSGGAWKGALIGGAVGLVSSYFIHNGMEERDADVRRETLLNLERFGVEGIPSSSQMYPEFYGFSGTDTSPTTNKKKVRQ